MFKIVPDPTFSAHAALTVPGEDKPVQLVIVWRHSDRHGLQQWLDDLSPQKPPAAADGAEPPLPPQPPPPKLLPPKLLPPKLSDVDGLAAVIADWDGVYDEEGNAVPFSKEMLRKLLDAYHNAGAELVRAYVRALTESRLGN